MHRTNRLAKQVRVGVGRLVVGECLTSPQSDVIVLSRGLGAYDNQRPIVMRAN